MRFFDNGNANPDAYYEPNSKGGVIEDPAVAEPPMNINGDVLRYEENDTYGDYKQAGDLYRLFDDHQKQRLHSNIAEAMRGVSRDIIELQLDHFKNADENYEKGIREKLYEFAELNKEKESV